MVAPPPRRPGPGGARPLPGGRPKLGISLGIPAANVPGGNVDQAGEGGWMSASGTPIRENPPPVLSAAASSSSPSPRPLPPPSIHPASVASVSAPPPRRPALPTLASNPLPSSGSSSSRPALSLHASSTSTAVPAFSLSTTTPTPSPHGGPHPPRLSGLHPPGPAGGHSPSPSPSPSASRPAIPTQSARPRLPTLALNGGPAPLTPAASPKPSLKLVNPYASPVAAGSVEDTPRSGSSSPVFSSYASSSSVVLPPPPPPQPQGRPRGPSLSLEIATPIRQAPPPPPPPPPMPQMPRHDPSSLLGYYYGDDEGGDERTVRPLSMDSDAGSYGAYGGLGAVYQAPGSLDRTLLPGSGVSERNQSSMVDDLRHTIGQLRVSASPLPSPGLGGGDGGGNGTGRGLVSQEKQQGPGEDEAAKAPLAFEASDLEDLAYLGEGAGGAVTKVRSKKTGVIMAKKLIPASPNPSIHRQILRELQFLADCTSPNIVDHYGSFLTDGDSMIGILMEYCEGKSLDAVVKESRERGLRSSEKILGKIAVAVLRGLDYLHERKIIHRDIKPSNVLVTRQGQFKICDFGVAGELVGSLAGTFTGTSFYMAPERILGKDYSIKSDVWSLGLSLLEVANNRFPFPPEGEPPIVGQFDLLNFIVNQDPPQLVDDESVTWTDKAKDFVRLCLERTDGQRPYPRDLILHPFVKSAEKRKTDLAKWIAHVWGWPQLQTAPTGGE